LQAQLLEAGKGTSPHGFTQKHQSLVPQMVAVKVQDPANTKDDENLKIFVALVDMRVHAWQLKRSYTNDKVFSA